MALFSIWRIWKHAMISLLVVFTLFKIVKSWRWKPQKSTKKPRYKFHTKHVACMEFITRFLCTLIFKLQPQFQSFEIVHANISVDETVKFKLFCWIYEMKKCVYHSSVCVAFLYCWLRLWHTHNIHLTHTPENLIKSYFVTFFVTKVTVDVTKKMIGLLSSEFCKTFGFLKSHLLKHNFDIYNSNFFGLLALVVKFS